MAIAALVASAFLHALWNALLKRERDPQVAVAGVLSTALAVAAVAWWLAPRPSFATPAALGWGVAAGVFEGAYFATLAAALARAPYGAVYTVARGGAMVLVWPAAALLLPAPVTAPRLAGAALLAAGLALVAGAPRGGASRAGLAWAAACAAAIAGYHLCYDAALASGARPAPLFGVALAVALPILLGWMRARGTLAAAAAPGAAAALRWALAGAICTASFLLFLAGLASTGAAVALTLRNTAVVFAQVLALAIGEVPPPRQLAGAALVIAGAAIVAAG
jgi:drug/metabolite transporter (DMT)-like permease